VKSSKQVIESIVEESSLVSAFSVTQPMKTLVVVDLGY
jgi:hypothetical protein